VIHTSSIAFLFSDHRDALHMLRKSVQTHSLSTVGALVTNYSPWDSATHPHRKSHRTLSVYVSRCPRMIFGHPTRGSCGSDGALYKFTLRQELSERTLSPKRHRLILHGSWKNPKTVSIPDNSTTAASFTQVEFEQVIKCMLRHTLSWANPRRMAGPNTGQSATQVLTWHPIFSEARRQSSHIPI